MTSATVLFILIFLTVLDPLPVRSIGVEQCYLCIDECKEPLETEECVDNDWQNMRCYASYATTPGGVLYSWKGCVWGDDEDWQARCAKLNVTVDSGCYMCDENLCNSQ